MFVIFFIFFCLPTFLGEFVSYPKNPKIGDTVVLRCILNAPGGQIFTSTAPDLEVNGSHRFSFSDVDDELNDTRFVGLHRPNETRRSLRGDLTIFFVKEQDFWLYFTCIAQLDNDAFIKLRHRINSTSNSDTEQEDKTPNYTPTPHTQNEQCMDWIVPFAVSTTLLIILFIIGIFGTIIYLCRKKSESYPLPDQEISSHISEKKPQNPELFANRSKDTSKQEVDNTKHPSAARERQAVDLPNLSSTSQALDLPEEMQEHT